MKEKLSNLKTPFQEYFIPVYIYIIKAMDEIDVSKNNEQGLSHLLSVIDNDTFYYQIIGNPTTFLSYYASYVQHANLKQKHEIL